MSIINFERDMFWSVGTTLLSPSAVAYGATMAISTDSNVAQRVNSFEAGFSSAVGASTYKCAGAILLPPADGDVTPYRYICDCSLQTDVPLVWHGYGWFDSGSISAPRIFGAGLHVDRVMALSPLDSADPNYGRPLCFFSAVGETFAGSTFVVGSIQRLIAKPPQFASAVS